MKKRSQQGFTLMELMVVIVIVAILAAVAVPLYVNYVKDAQRTEAKGAIGAVITAEQTYFQLNPDGGPPHYTTDTFKTNPQPGDQKLNCDLTDALVHWTIEVTSADANGFVVLATNKADGTMTQKLTYTRTGGGSWDPQ